VALVRRSFDGPRGTANNIGNRDRSESSDVAYRESFAALRHEDPIVGAHGHRGSQAGTTRLGKTNDAGAARREERIAGGQLQLRQSLPPGGLRFDLAGLRQLASSACASAISGNSGVGENPSSAGASTVRASAARPVD
jgi:hypothetical protein